MRAKRSGIGFSWALALAALLVAAVLSGCGANSERNGPELDAAADSAEPLVGEASGAVGVAEKPGGNLSPILLPTFQALQLEGRKLKVVATTSIVGDVVSQVGGGAIDLTVLMKPGQDPHSYEPSAGDLTAAARADVLFVNGWDLEEGLIQRLESVAEGVPQIAVSANIQPLIFRSFSGPGATATSVSEARIDPHTWMDPHNGLQWAINVREVLTALDPTRAGQYQSNFVSFERELQQLITEFNALVATIPPERRKLVTNHDALAYFARAFQFSIVGSIVPGGGTLAEPSAKELADLVTAMESEDICVVFAETSSNQELAQVLAKEVKGCPQVRVETLYTGAIGTPGSGADSYIGMMRSNLQAIVGGLRD